MIPFPEGFYIGVLLQQVWVARFASYPVASSFPSHLVWVFLPVLMIQFWVSGIKINGNSYQKKKIVLQLTICLYLNSSVRSTCLRAGPLSTPRTRVAKFSEQSVSPKSVALGLTWTNIKVLQSPPAFQPRSTLQFKEKHKPQRPFIKATIWIAIESLLLI